jgi:hypothetical protein
VISEAAVRRVIGVEGAQTLIDIVGGAWQDYVNEGISRYHRSTRANVVWDYMAKRSDAELAAMDGVERVELSGRPLYSLRNRLLLRPKFHMGGATQNVPTRRQRSAAVDGLLPEFGLDLVSFGYQLDRAEAGISDFVVSAPSETWIINLEELASGELAPVTQLLPGMEGEDLESLEPIRKAS